MNLKTSIEFRKEDSLYIAYSPELDMIAQGYSYEEARNNLMEMIDIHIEEMQSMGTLDAFLHELGIHFENGAGVSKKDRIGFDKVLLPLPPQYRYST